MVVEGVGAALRVLYDTVLVQQRTIENIKPLSVHRYEASTLVEQLQPTLAFMKLAITFLWTALLSFTSAQENGHWRFRPRATTYRGTTPSLSGFVDLDSAGLAGFSRISADYPGFVSVSSTFCPPPLAHSLTQQIVHG